MTTLSRVLVAGIFITAAAARAEGPAEEAAIKDLDARRVQAMVRADVKALDPMLADDLTYTHASGIFDTKASLLSSISSGKLKYKSLELTDPRVRVYGNVAVVNGRAAVQAESATLGPLSLKLFYTDVWTRQPDGRWRMVAWQSTRIPEPSPAP
ncbi:MAG: nuclear transport factor 2 family protein [Acidobacteria bacterium]|nr:MAG: nuclear transport factor 2 family protein [Acidobacteriota bacterium]